MSKTKPSGAIHYELLFVLPNKFTEEEAKAASDRVEAALGEQGGVITSREFWGKKKLAYPIQHNVYGYYSLLEFDLEGKELAKIDKVLRLSSEVIRFLVTKKKVKSEAEIQREAKITAKINSKKAEEQKQKDEAAAAKKEADKPAVRSKSKEVKEADDKSLDEKLEGILSAKDLI
jgi:small subunit ribosomal protein S6